MNLQEIKALLENRYYSEINQTVYQSLLDELSVIYSATNYGEELPQDLVELRDWVYNRVCENIMYQSGSYLSDHFCIGVIYGILRAYDDAYNCSEAWYNKYSSIVKNLQQKRIVDLDDIIQIFLAAGAGVFAGIIIMFFGDVILLEDIIQIKNQLSEAKLISRKDYSRC